MTVLLGGHGEGIAVGEHFRGDLRDGLIGVALLVHLDKVAVFRPAGHIEHHRDIVAVGHPVDLLDVVHGNGLPTHGVIRDAAEDQRHILRPHAFNELLQLFDVHVALEGVLLIAAALRDRPQQLFIVKVAWNRAHLLDVALGGIEVTIGGNGEFPAGVTLTQDIPHDLHQHGLRRPALLDDKGVGTLHLGRAAVEEAALVLAEIDLIHHLLHIPAIGADKVNDLFPVFLPAPLENVPERVQQYVVAGVAAVGLVPQEQGGPLLVRHGGGAGVGEHIHRQKAGGEGELIVVCGFQGPLPLLNGNLGNIADSKGKMMGRGNIQRILCVHTSFTSILRVHRTLFFGDTPVGGEPGFPHPLCVWRTVSQQTVRGKAPFPCCRDHSIIPENKKMSNLIASHAARCFLRRFDRAPPCGIIEDNLANHKAAPPQAGPVFSNSHKGSAFYVYRCKNAFGRSRDPAPRAFDGPPDAAPQSGGRSRASPYSSLCQAAPDRTGLCAPRHGRRRHGGHHRNGYWPLRAAADRHGCAADSGGHRTGISVRKRRHARLRP